MIELTDKARAYCQKLIDALENEGYFFDAKIVGETLKMMNGEKVAMATMDEQKPKFNVGDWIIRDSDGLTISIKSVKDGIYYFHQGGNLFVKDVDECFHLWTIQDAKDGDVLVASDSSIFLFKCVVDTSLMKKHVKQH